ncbi:MAG: class I SAM-dependent methyltransferase [Saprospiraceae bacterium]|nr:class I SAM-dependent methyltransferase [Saprospiraceae bacterium]
MSYEKEYYEFPGFWSGSALDDEINRIRINTTSLMIPDDCSSLLDVGCGNGKFIHKVLELRPGMRVIGTDRSQEAIQYLQAEKFVSDIDHLEVNDGFADCISCLQVLEHIHDATYHQSLAELARVAKKYLLISVPYNEDLKKSFTECPKCLSNFSWELHMRSYSDEVIDTLFLLFGFKLIDKKNIVQYETLAAIDKLQKFRNLLRPKPIKTFRSPICIICGYKPEQDITTVTSLPSTPFHKDSGWKRQLKKFWPKKKMNGYWIIALYQRI